MPIPNHYPIWGYINFRVILKVSPITSLNPEDIHFTSTFLPECKFYQRVNVYNSCWMSFKQSSLWMKLREHGTEFCKYSLVTFLLKANEHSWNPTSLSVVTILNMWNELYVLTLVEYWKNEISNSKVKPVFFLISSNPKIRPVSYYSARIRIYFSHIFQYYNINSL